LARANLIGRAGRGCAAVVVAFRAVQHRAAALARADLIGRAGRGRAAVVVAFRAVQHRAAALARANLIGRAGRGCAAVVVAFRAVPHRAAALARANLIGRAGRGRAAVVVTQRVAYGHRDRIAHLVAVVALCVVLRGLGAGGGAGQLAGCLGREAVRPKVAVFSFAVFAHGFLRAGGRAAVMRNFNDPPNATTFTGEYHL